jgi:acetylornithine deacetylase
MTHVLLDSTLDLLDSLIAFDTRSSESNLALIEFIQRYLKRHDVESSLVFDETGRKANLYATIGPKDRAGLCLSGHTDVVPADGQPWTVPPFEMTRGREIVCSAVARRT